MKPFLKWAGGKRWLFTPEFIETLPQFDRYIEPFLGGGAGFLSLTPQNSIISDVNYNLISVYEVVRDNHEALVTTLAKHQERHSPEYYYTIRSKEYSCKVEKASQFIYLNRTCWNGLYRLNKKGKFNVPIGSKTKVLLPDDDFASISAILKNSSLRCCDFEETISEAQKGDLLFVDPPYTVAHNKNGFVKYNEKIFSWDDQVRLRDSIVQAVERGAALVLTNADHSSVRSLYEEVGIHASLERPSVISGSTKGRSKISELMVTA
ncbi:Dam family site-specific DNA-(adenine-N6)-methyltransferase [Phaeobacter gallaeciensis]|uniref:DNA adenine methylase n=1 Tax=Phaeobacter gallaeciensis TaxID=60890 RepID=UPI0023805063|nr:Dam family site-specific DNA-(adenine-N6)-methyltransferase [Phaeobacter gallaeciensis]MDE4272943.1 Dam family site-specific DNA-(adenine-N6)-methyltransferase [Phaeobacter gallaeciensis]MDE4298104.1 Dam family site-specific DNA-(adenine-N6)-methyltransferase [Phaeobacter gallaeciensis]MDE5183292.1 Dam family site-specific DNA-(adenine-N6)-methyltransferase [Phaeobacter gallaeciensis]